MYPPILKQTYKNCILENEFLLFSSPKNVFSFYKYLFNTYYDPDTMQGL